MKALKVLGIIIGVIAVVIILLILFLSGEVRMERSVVINADKEAVYNELNSYKSFNEWSPWFQRDPDATYTYEGPDEGVDARIAWQSDMEEVGNGAMWIVESEENEMIKNRMEFGGYPGEPYANFYLEDVAEGTKVTWTYEEDLGGLWKLSTLFVDMDEMIGPDYELGLENLKEYIEAGGSTRMTQTEGVQMVQIIPIPYLGFEATVDPNNVSALGNTITEVYGKVIAQVDAEHAPDTGNPMAVYQSFGDNQIELVIALSMPDTATLRTIRIEDGVVGTTDKGMAIRSIHKGSYNNLLKTHDKIKQYINDQKLQITGSPYEIYKTGPANGQNDTTTWETEIYYPVNQQ